MMTLLKSVSVFCLLCFKIVTFQEIMNIISNVLSLAESLLEALNLIIISAFTISVCVIFIICYGGQHMVNIVKQIELRCLYVLIYMLHQLISVGTDNIWPSPKIHSVLFHVSNYNTITTQTISRTCRMNE